jgi:hypothetical protein
MEPQTKAALVGATAWAIGLLLFILMASPAPV